MHHKRKRFEEPEREREGETLNVVRKNCVVTIGTPVVLILEIFISIWNPFIDVGLFKFPKYIIKFSLKDGIYFYYKLYLNMNYYDKFCSN